MKSERILTVWDSHVVVVVAAAAEEVGGADDDHYSFYCDCLKKTWRVVEMMMKLQVSIH